MFTLSAPRCWRLAVSAFALFAVAPAVQAQPKSSVESLFTPETVGFLHVRVSEVWESPSLAFYRKMLGGLGEAELKAFDEKFTPSPSQIESLTVIMPSMNVRMPIPDGRPVGESMLWVINTKKPIERGDLIRALGLDSRIKSHRGTDYVFDEEHWAGIIQLDATTILAASEDSIIKVIEQRDAVKGKGSPLTRILAQEGSKHSAVLAVNPLLLATKEFLREAPKEIHPLMTATSAWIALDLKKESLLSATIEFGTAEQATAGRKAVEGVRNLFLDLIAKGQKQLQTEEARSTKRLMMGPLDMPALIAPVLGKAALKYIENALKGLKIEVKATTLSTSLNLTEFFPAHGDALAVLSFFVFSERGGSYYQSYHGYEREEIPYYLRENFDRISAALQAYHADKGNFPPAAIYDKEGKPLLSWRVLILPYLEQRQWEGQFDGPRPPMKFDPNNPPARRTFTDLYKQFKLDEPWDSLNNKKLLERMPSVFRVEFSAQNWRMRSEWKTGMQVFTGPGTLFPGKEAISRGQVRDGLDTTIAVAFRDDLMNAVAWTKPADMQYGPKKQMPKLLYLPPDSRGPVNPAVQGIYAIMADGQSRRFPLDFDEKVFRGLITIDGGEAVKLPERKQPSNPNFPRPQPFEK